MSSPKSESNQAPITQDQESETLQQKVEQGSVENIQPEFHQHDKTDNAEIGNKGLDESSTLNRSGEKTAKKKTKKKAKKEEETTGDVPAAQEGEAKEAQPEAEKNENNEEPSEKKPKKKKKTAEKIEIPATAEGEALQQEEQAPKPKKKAAKKNAETTLVANIVTDAKQEAPNEQAAKQPTEEAPKVDAKATTIKTKKAKATGESAKDEAADKKPEVMKPSASKATLVKEDTKSPTKIEKPAEQNKANVKGAESEKVNWKAGQQTKSDNKAVLESATKKPVNLKEQVTSPTKNKNEVVAKNSEKKPETPAGKGKKPALEVDTTNNNNILEGVTPTTKEGKTPDATKSAKKVTVNETAREQRSIPPRKQIKGADKQRVRSFDAGKTQKVDPNDPFDVRCKVWEIRKKEKLLEEEKKSSRKEIEECTFNPAINKKALLKANLNGDFLQRNAEWSEKQKASLQYKTDKHLEEVMKSDIKKSKIQPAVGSDLRSVRLHEVHRAPNSGNLRAANFELLNQDPVGVQERLHEKLAEINDIYDNISSALKAKSARNRDDIQRVARPITMDSSRKSQPISHPAKHLAAKVVQPSSTDDLNRLESLKSILISNKKKEPVNKSITNTDAPNSQVFLSETNKAQTILNSPGKHLEIRGNRYVMVDNNISGIEKKDLESHDISLNLETA